MLCALAPTKCSNLSATFVLLHPLVLLQLDQRGLHAVHRLASFHWVLQECRQRHRPLLGCAGKGGVRAVAPHAQAGDAQTTCLVLCVYCCRQSERQLAGLCTACLARPAHLLPPSHQGVCTALHADDANTTADNLAALLAFYDRFPEYRNRTLFLAGESYSGAPSCVRLPDRLLSSR